MVKPIKNSKKQSFLTLLNSKKSIEDNTNTLASRCKFNFSYLDFSQESAGQINDVSLIDNLINKLKHYSEQPLDYWREQCIGSKKQTVLEIYKNFPAKSKFKEPKNIPIEAQWARFRMDGKKRLIGFVLPREYSTKQHASGYTFDTNTFYVVFLDPLHHFYLLDD